jgi:hypothetical protein
MTKTKQTSSNNVPRSDQFRSAGSYLNLSNVYVAHEAEPRDSQEKLRRNNFVPVSVSFWESRYALRRRALKLNRRKQFN